MTWTSYHWRPGFCFWISSHQ